MYAGKEGSTSAFQKCRFWCISILRRSQSQHFQGTILVGMEGRSHKSTLCTLLKMMTILNDPLTLGRYHVPGFDVEESELVLSRHEASLDVANLQTVQRQHVLLVLLLETHSGQRLATVVISRVSSSLSRCVIITQSLCHHHSVVVSSSLSRCVTITQSLCHHHSVVASSSLSRCVIITQSLHHHHSVVVSSSLSRCVIITQSLCHHHSVVVSSSLSRCVIITQSLRHHHSVVVSSSLSRCVIITQSLCHHHSVVVSSSLSRCVIITQSLCHHHSVVVSSSFGSVVVVRRLVCHRGGQRLSLSQTVN